MKEILSQTDNVVTVSFDVLNHPIDDLTVGKPGVYPGPLRRKSSIPRQILLHLAGGLVVGATQLVVLARATPSRDGLVHFGAHTATGIHQAVQGDHAARLIQLDHQFADLSCVRADRDEQLLLKFGVLDLAVRLCQYFQLVLEPLKKHVNFQIEFFLDIGM